MIRWTEDQRALRAGMSQWCAAFSDGFLERDQSASFGADRWKLVCESGLLGLPFDKRWGGLGQDLRCAHARTLRRSPSLRGVRAGDVYVELYDRLPPLVGAAVEGLSVDELTYHKPVYPGDTIFAKSTVVDRRPSCRNPKMGIAKWHTQGFNQHGELVCDFKRSNLINKRNP